jgi:NADPH:quinone reductase-like Zn-dependent oxidoreductase
VLPRFDAREVQNVWVAAPPQVAFAAVKQVTVGEVRLLKPSEAMRAPGRPLRAALSFRTVAASASLRAMRILVAGASGVLGRSTLPHLDRHEVVGLTRRGDKLQLLRDLGAEGVVCDV